MSPARPARSGGTLLDTSVLLDVVCDDPQWGAWSRAALAAALDAGPVVLNPVVIAEASVHYTRIEELAADLRDLALVREPLSDDAAFLAGRAFEAAGRAGGASAAPLPDFLIGAHAAVAGYTLLTRDPGRVRAHFPTVPVPAPETTP